MGSVKTGVERFIQTPPKSVLGKRLGLLSNPASVDRQLLHTRNLININFPGQLKALYSPQHGFFAEKQDNMIESNDITDPVLQIPVFSLYGQTRKPTKEMLDPVDILIIDLQDAGTRVYTFIYTMSYCLEAAKSFNKKVIVLDRPNPINGIMVEGNCLSLDYASFVGRYPLPMRHGLTIGELALLFNNYFGIGCDLEVIRMENWNRDMYFTNTGLPWIPPSPNLPTPVSAMVYPGQVLWEGTNISEGRGTTQPFELFGSPFMNTENILTAIGGNEIPGGLLRQTVFEPTSNKWKSQLCKGFQIHITNPDKYRPFSTTLKLLQAVIACHNEQFEFTAPPYEYEYDKLPIDLIIGDRKIRRRIEKLDNIDKIEKSWENKLADFKKISSKFHLYK